MKFIPITLGIKVRLTDKVEEVVSCSDVFSLFIQLIKNFVRDPSKKIQRSIIPADRVAVKVMTVENRESDVDQRSSGVAHQLFTIAVTDHKINRFSEEK